MADVVHRPVISVEEIRQARLAYFCGTHQRTPDDNFFQTSENCRVVLQNMTENTNNSNIRCDTINQSRQPIAAGIAVHKQTNSWSLESEEWKGQFLSRNHDPDTSGLDSRATLEFSNNTKCEFSADRQHCGQINLHTNDTYPQRGIGQANIDDTLIPSSLNFRNNSNLEGTFTEAVTTEISVLGEQGLQNILMKSARDLEQLHGGGSHNHINKDLGRMSPDSVSQVLDGSSVASQFSPVKSLHMSNIQHTSLSSSTDFSSSGSKELKNQSSLAQTITKNLQQLNEDKGVTTLERNYDQITVSTITKYSFSSEEIYRQAFGDQFHRLDKQFKDHVDLQSVPHNWQERPGFSQHSDLRTYSDVHAHSTPLHFSSVQNQNMFCFPPPLLPCSHVDLSCNSNLPPSPHFASDCNSLWLQSNEPQTYLIQYRSRSNHQLQQDCPDLNKVYADHESYLPAQPSTYLQSPSLNRYPPSFYSEQRRDSVFTNRIPLHLPPPPFPQRAAQLGHAYHHQVESRLPAPPRREDLTQPRSSHHQALPDVVLGGQFGGSPCPPLVPAMLQPQIGSHGFPDRYEHRSLPDDQTYARQKKLVGNGNFENYNLQRYFSSLVCGNTLDADYDVPVVSLGPAGECGSVFTDYTVTSTETPSGWLHRVHDPDISLDHFKHIQLVDEARQLPQASGDAEVLSKRIQRCSACSESNTPDMDRCVVCGELLAGFEIISHKRISEVSNSEQKQRVMQGVTLHAGRNVLHSPKQNDANTDHEHKCYSSKEPFQKDATSKEVSECEKETFMIEDDQAAYAIAEDVCFESEMRSLQEIEDPLTREFAVSYGKRQLFQQNISLDPIVQTTVSKDAAKPTFRASEPATVNLASVTTASVSTTLVTTASVTMASWTTALITTASITTASVTTASLATAPVTTAPVITASWTTTPVTTAPWTNASVTNASVTTASWTATSVNAVLCTTEPINAALDTTTRVIATFTTPLIATLYNTSQIATSVITTPVFATVGATISVIATIGTSAPVTTTSGMCKPNTVGNIMVATEDDDAFSIDQEPIDDLTVPGFTLDYAVSHPESAAAASVGPKSDSGSIVPVIHTLFQHNKDANVETSRKQSPIKISKQQVEISNDNGVVMKRKNKKEEIVDIEIFGYDETRKSCSQTSKRVVPVLNLKSSSDEEAEDDEDIENFDDETSKSVMCSPPDKFLPQPGKQFTCRKNQPTGNHIPLVNTVPCHPIKVTQKSSAQSSFSNPKALFCHHTSRGSVFNNPAHHYRRHWTTSSIAWDSYNPGELNTKSSLNDRQSPPQRGIHPPPLLTPLHHGSKGQQKAKGEKEHAGPPAQYRPFSTDGQQRQAGSKLQRKSSSAKIYSRQQSIQEHYPMTSGKDNRPWTASCEMGSHVRRGGSLNNPPTTSHANVVQLHPPTTSLHNGIQPHPPALHRDGVQPHPPALHRDGVQPHPPALHRNGIQPHPPALDRDGIQPHPPALDRDGIQPHPPALDRHGIQPHPPALDRDGVQPHPPASHKDGVHSVEHDSKPPCVGKSQRPALEPFQPGVAGNDVVLCKDDSPRLLCGELHRLPYMDVREAHSDRLHAVAENAYIKLQEMTPRVAEGQVSLWQCLPDEIWLYIFNFVSHVDLVALMLTSRYFKRLANDLTLWKYITVKPKYSMTDLSLTTIARRQPVSLAMVKCQGSQLTLDSLHYFFRETKDTLKELNICGCSQGSLVGSVLLEVACLYCSQLTHLDVSFCHVSDQALVAMSNCADRLESVCLNGFQSLTDLSLLAVLEKHGHSLQTLELYACFLLSPASLTYIGKSCSRLRRLCLGSCNKLTDTIMTDLSKSLMHIEELDLRSYKRLKDDCVKEIVHNCPWVHTLVLANCPLISDVALTEMATYLKTTLRVLDICGCNRVTDDGLKSLAKNCCQLTTLDISSTRCTGASARLLADSLCSKFLESVRLSFLSGLTEACLLHLIRLCPRLKSVHVYGCSSLKNVAKLQTGNPRLSVEGD